ncbi:MAG TPA: response regulator [Terriglobia bacterium]|nr:response regulator [Terriglobia bacterium]
MAGNMSEQVLLNVKYLRRYARALLGSQQSGDSYVRLCLETLLQQQDALLSAGNVKYQLFKLFHDVWDRVHVGMDDPAEELSPLAADFSVKARLEAMPLQERQILLLTALEGFTPQEAGEILDLPQEQAEALLAKAWATVSEQISTSVLVIEDEPVIAYDISGLVGEMGHTVVGTAADQAEAIAIARQKRPGLVLADIDLGSGGSGLLAVQEILQSLDIPVIFITAYPERLLTGERPEPAYLVTKPFEPDTLRVTISQALSLKKIDERRNDQPELRGAAGA